MEKIINGRPTEMWEEVVKDHMKGMGKDVMGLAE